MLWKFKSYLRQLWYRFDLWLCHDIIEEELTNALHPEFGYIWEDDQQGGIAIVQARKEGFIEGYKIAHDTFCIHCNPKYKGHFV